MLYVSVDQTKVADSDSLVVRCCFHGRLNIVYCRVPVRSYTWVEVQASTDTLVGQPPYHETRGWEEVMPWRD
jgi:hypothetical protein